MTICEPPLGRTNVLPDEVLVVELVGPLVVVVDVEESRELDEATEEDDDAVVVVEVQHNPTEELVEVVLVPVCDREVPDDENT
jgi:hypothetical protein